MTVKKVFGYIFFALAILLSITLIALLKSFITTIVGFFMIFSGKLDAYGIGKVIGSLIYWAVHISVIILLWKYGRKWTRKQITATPNNQPAEIDRAFSNDNRQQVP